MLKVQHREDVVRGHLLFCSPRLDDILTWKENPRKQALDHGTPGVSHGFVKLCLGP